MEVSYVHAFVPVLHQARGLYIGTHTRTKAEASTLLQLAEGWPADRGS
jgi:hypothetical protein